MMVNPPIVPERRRSDRCPFRRPFPRDFKDCSAFEAVEYATTDFAGHHLRPILTCAHLENAPLDPNWPNGSAYARCSIGGHAERAAYAARRRLDS